MGNLLGKVNLINETGKDIEFREFRGPSVDFKQGNFFDVIPVRDGETKKVDGRKYRQASDNSLEVSVLMIFSGGSLADVEPLYAQDFIECKTITITKEEIVQDSTSTESVEYRYVITKEPLLV